MILIIIKFDEFCFEILQIVDGLKSYVKHSKEYFIRFPNTSKSVFEKNSAAPRFCNPLLGVW